MTQDTNLETTGQAAERERLLARIRQYLQEQQGIDPSVVDEGTNFRDDLVIDSLDLAAMALALETEYGVRLDDEAVLTVETVGEACDLILNAAATAART